LKNLTEAVYKTLQQHHAAIEQMLRKSFGQEGLSVPAPVAPDADFPNHQRLQIGRASGVSK
jgi:hypothetical protein